MKHFALVLLAGLLTLGMSAGVGKLTAEPVHAFNACGFPYDLPDTVYADGYTQGFMTVFSSNPQSGGYQHIGFDVAAYRVEHNGDCLRGYYGSGWDNERFSVYAFTSHLRVWICGAPAADFQLVQYQTWGLAVVSARSNQVWGVPYGGAFSAWVNTPDGNTWLMDFADYSVPGSSPCGRQVDNVISSYQDGYMSPTSGYVYQTLNGP